MCVLPSSTSMYFSFYNNGNSVFNIYICSCLKNIKAHMAWKSLMRKSTRETTKAEGHKIKPFKRTEKINTIWYSWNWFPNNTCMSDGVKMKNTWTNDRGQLYIFLKHFIQRRAGHNGILEEMTWFLAWLYHLILLSRPKWYEKITISVYNRIKNF